MRTLLLCGAGVIFLALYLWLYPSIVSLGPAMGFALSLSFLVVDAVRWTWRCLRPAPERRCGDTR